MRIVVADDHPLYRRGVIDIIRTGIPDTQFNEASNAKELFAAMRTDAADLVILDLSLPDRHGLDCLGDLQRQYPSVPVLVLSMHPEELFAMRAFEQGAMGYIPKDQAGLGILTAIERVRSGKRYIGPDLAESMAMQSLNATTASPHETLSEREFRVLRELAHGTPLATIGRALNISPKTVTTYRARVLTKLKLESNADLVRYALEHKIVE